MKWITSLIKVILLLLLPSLLIVQASDAGIGIDRHKQHAPVPQPAVAEAARMPGPRDPVLEPGFPVTVTHSSGTFMSGPVICVRAGNIDADLQLEILFTGTAQGPLHAWNSDGSHVPGWPVYLHNRAFYPSLGSLSNDFPGLEVFAGQYEHRVPTSPPGPIVAYNGAGATLPGWPRDSGYEITAPAALADVDGDGLDEIFIYENDFLLHAYHADGSTLAGWPVDSDSPQPTIADLDGDGDLEIITLNDWSSDGAYLIAYHHDGTRVAGLSFYFLPGGKSYPIVGDVDGDYSPEIIVIRSVLSIPETLIVSVHGTVEHVMHDHVYGGFCYCPCSHAQALADLDADGNPEIVQGCTEGMIAWRGDGTLFPGSPAVWGNCCEPLTGNNSPVVGDLDGDQWPDIVMANSLYGADGDIYVADRYGNVLPGFPITLGMSDGATPAIADIDLDGRNELVIGGGYVWAYDLGGEQHGAIEWGQFGGGPRNQRYYPPRPSSTPGVDLSWQVPASEGAPLDGVAAIPIRYVNHGGTLATSVTLTAMLDSHLAYIGDTSGITPTVAGDTVTWHLPPLAYHYRKDFRVLAQLAGAAYGDRFPVLLELSSSQPDANPGDNTATIEVVVVRQSFLPLALKED